MTQTAKSQLNPLANAFIPTNQDEKQTNLQVAVESSKKVITILDGTKRKKLNDWESASKKSKEMAVTLRHKNSFFIDVFFFGSISSMVNMFFKSSLFKGPKPEVRCSASSSLSMLPECPSDKGLLKCNSLQVAEEKVKCSCPPMFGWIIPPQFIGNPFNFKFECCKKYPHNPNSIEKQPHFDKIDKKINDLTLDQCYSEIKNILADVYESISDPISKDFKIVSMSDCEMDDKKSNKSKYLDWDATCKVSTKIELVDDGCHPLLQLTPLIEDEDEKELVKVETILGKTLMYSSLPDSLESLTLNPGSVCDPPCSVWCEFLPTAAKETFKKSIQRTDGSKDFPKACQRMAFKHMYKRSFSADDAVVLGRKNQVSDIKSKEMFLRRKYQNFQIIDRKMQESGDSYLLNTNVDKSNMWGKFDGIDSLWQPLPECMPMNVQYQKLNCHKRGREIRCQRLN